MGLIVQKFGGSSVADTSCIRNVARIITEAYKKGDRVVAVLSAQGDTTDNLIKQAEEMNSKASHRELDMLLSTGEQISCALCAMAIEAMGCPVISLTGWQAGVHTNSDYGNAHIKRVNTERIKAELEEGKIVLVTGFQGISQTDDITTLGRGGSDTSAVALAVALHADLCQIYTDVDGIYTADPRLVSGARKLEEISYDEMLELASLGAQVLHNRSVELAKRHHIDLEVLSSFSNQPGTKLKKETQECKDIPISGVACNREVEGGSHVSIVGIHLWKNPTTASTMLKALSSADINIGMMTKRDISMSVLVKREDADRGMQAVHDRFYNNR